MPFQKMKSEDELTKDKYDYCLAREGEIYAIYMPVGKATDIKIPNNGYSVNWFNPREGGDLHQGSVNKITGGGFASTGNPPVQDGKDWVCLIRRE
ncbi:MAG: hypothetical protein A2V50_02615 [Bacteroidetes bacterium RBG_19FT_COMBO_42_10]|nr:MAG: hypothetical protein A2V50_02615 [Bacteroidetes bacterium RBG_19FT_COMBO_42_10]